MIAVLRDSWALLFGLLLLMLGNGLLGTLLGVRGSIEGMSPATLSYVMSSYFAGLLVGARLVPRLIKRVGHVRVFAALASLISAAFILFAAAPHPVAWAAMRFLVGFCFCGVYVVAESWLNAKSTNETRGQTMSAYMLIQLAGLVGAQGLLVLADPGGYVLFVIISVLVSVAVAPILLSASPAPVYETARPMSLIELYRSSPLGVVAAFLLGGLFSAIFGMSSVYGSEAGLSVEQIALFVTAIYLGGLLFQYPIGWLSDRFDRRFLIVATCAMGVGAAALALTGPGFWTVLALAAVLGGAINPLYSLVIAHTNDFLDSDQMASASGALIFLNGAGAVGGPIAVGFAMDSLGPGAFFGYIGVLLGAISLYGLYRMTQRPAPSVEETGPYAPIAMTAGAVAQEATQDIVSEIVTAAEAEAEAAAQDAACDDKTPQLADSVR
jgi:MFS family permease